MGAEISRMKRNSIRQNVRRIGNIPATTRPIIQEAESVVEISQTIPIPKLFVSPVQLEDLSNFVSEIPYGDDENKFKYYCPLCMNYFQSIMKSNCCGNYICYHCCQDYLVVKKCNIKTINDIMEYSKEKPIACPNCMTDGFVPVLVDHQDCIRDYSQSPMDIPPILPRCSSPVRVGDSFENLKRKMILYTVYSNSFQESTNEHNDDFVGFEPLGLAYNNNSNEDGDDERGSYLSTISDRLSNSVESNRDSLNNNNSNNNNNININNNMGFLSRRSSCGSLEDSTLHLVRNTSIILDSSLEEILYINDHADFGISPSIDDDLIQQ